MSTAETSLESSPSEEMNINENSFETSIQSPQSAAAVNRNKRSPNTDNSGNVKNNNHSSSSKPCAFFAQGMCRNGNECRFSHNLNLNQPVPIAGVMGPPTAPLIINIPPGHPVFSIDVECVATAVQHNARSIAQVALVDEWSRPIFNVFIKQDLPVLSYINELTGLTAELLDKHGLPLGNILFI